jgi:hypothetical protein
MTLLPLIRRALLGTALAGALAACGGGSSQYEPFQPGRVIAFGDEASYLTTDGRKYSINALDSSSQIDCDSNPLWIQGVAALYGYRFAECLGDATEAKAFTRAAPGATVADVQAQVDAWAAQGFAADDLVLMMAGANDVRQILESRSATETDDDLVARAREAGVAMADLVNRVVSLGARVIIATAPDQGVTPWALARGTADAALLTRLSAAFNGRLRVGILNDGRYIGLVLADEIVQSAVVFPWAYGLSNVKDAACLESAPLPDCQNVSTSLVEGASATGWLWADSLRFGPTLQRQIGVVAAGRAANNPF